MFFISVHSSLYCYVEAVTLASLPPTAFAPPRANLALPPPAAQTGIVTGSGGLGCDYTRQGIIRSVARLSREYGGTC